MAIVGDYSFNVEYCPGIIGLGQVDKDIFLRVKCLQNIEKFLDFHSLILQKTVLDKNSLFVMFIKILKIAAGEAHRAPPPAATPRKARPHRSGLLDFRAKDTPLR